MKAINGIAPSDVLSEAHDEIKNDQYKKAVALVRKIVEQREDAHARRKELEKELKKVNSRITRIDNTLIAFEAGDWDVLKAGEDRQ